MVNSHHFPRKRFGQNFLVDEEVIQKILYAINPASDDHIVEIGPGRGVLTQKLIDKVGHFDAIEIDRDLVVMLQPLFARHQATARLYSADVLDFDFASLQSLFDTQKLIIVGNLPYNITTPIIFHALSFAKITRDLHFMVQREVAERLYAEPGSKIYGRLSVMVQYYCKVEILFDVSPTSFSPAPQVYSSLVRLIPRKFSLVANNLKTFAEVVSLAFNQRRKTLRNSLHGLVDESEWQRLDIDSQLRPEQLSVKHFVMISNIITKRDGNYSAPYLCVA